MMNVRAMEPGDAAAIVARIERQLDGDARKSALVSNDFDRDIFEATLLLATSSTWVCENEEGVVGHLYAALLDDPSDDLAEWTGPDGVSFDSPEVLALLITSASASWRIKGARRHFAWVFHDDDRLAPWKSLGYIAKSYRGVMRLGEETAHNLLDTNIRYANSNDMERLLFLDDVIDEAQGDDATSISKTRDVTREHFVSLLNDPDARHYVYEDEDGVIAQAITFDLGARRGSFDATVHLSEVAVSPSRQRRGVGRTLIDYVLNEARREGFQYVEAQWRASNHGAQDFWTSYGLRPTYVCLTTQL
jgi:ribosomal protein S18 acetylase RimI-like enzyme